MKQVYIFIRPNMYFKTKAALVENSFHSMSVKDVLGRGKGSGKCSFVAGNEESLVNYMDNPFIAKKMIEIFCRDEDVDRLISVVKKVNQTGNPGDGKVFVLEAEEIIRIRTGEKNDNALM